MSTITIVWSCHVINLIIFPIFYVQILTVTGYEIRRHLYLCSLDDIIKS